MSSNGTYNPSMSRSVLLVLALALPLSGCGYNSLVSGDENVKAAWAQVENVYQRRADLIPNLVNTVKGSAAHEEKTLQEVTAARASATQVKLSVDDLSNPEKVKQFEDAQAKLSSSLGRLIATSEAYPDLKANAAFRDLMTQLEGTENRITVERRRYNEAVRDYNVKVREFPTMIAAKIWGFHPKTPFTATTANAATAPEVKF
jgi:LemA protein